MIACGSALPTAAAGLLARARLTAPPADETPADYDWLSPCRFDPAQRRRLDELATAAAAELSQRLGRLLQMPVDVRPGSFTQHYGRALRAPATQEGAYRMSLLVGEGGPPAGWISLEAAWAVAWVGRLLGGAATIAAAEPRPLSSLETTLLQDVFSTMTGGLAEAWRNRLTASPLPASGPELRDDDTYGCFQFRVGDQPAVAITMNADWAEDLAAAAATPRKAPGELRQAILAHLEYAAAEALALTAEAKIAARDLMALEAGDVLLLNLTPQDLVRLVVDGQTILTGEPVVCEGHYAVRIAAPLRAPGGSSAPGAPDAAPANPAPAKPSRKTRHE